MNKLSHQKDNDDKRSDEPSSMRSYARYSGVVVQMTLIILAAVWGGRRLDEVAGNEKPVFTALLSLIGVVGAIYITIKDLIK